MAKRHYVYRPDGTGHFRAVPVRGATKRRDYDPDEPFKKKMMRAYYNAECEQGSRFSADYGDRSARQIKAAWDREE